VARARLIIGIICVAVAIWMFLSGEFSENPAPAIAVAVIGLILIVMAKRSK
jgi:hypothetical protein